MNFYRDKNCYKDNPLGYGTNVQVNILNVFHTQSSLIVSFWTTQRPMSTFVDEDVYLDGT